MGSGEGIGLSDIDKRGEDTLNEADLSKLSALGATAINAQSGNDKGHGADEQGVHLGEDDQEPKDAPDYGDTISSSPDPREAEAENDAESLYAAGQLEDYILDLEGKKRKYGLTDVEKLTLRVYKKVLEEKEAEETGESKA